MDGKDYCLKKKVSIFAFFKLEEAAKRVKHVMANRSVLRVYKHDILDAHDAAEVIPDPKILENFIIRIKRYGDIFNGKTEDEVKTLLQRHNNYAPDAVLEVILELEENG